jgi:hypothetical protein
VGNLANLANLLILKMFLDFIAKAVLGSLKQIENKGNMRKKYLTTRRNIQHISSRHRGARKDILFPLSHRQHDSRR